MTDDSVFPDGVRRADVLAAMKAASEVGEFHVTAELMQKYDLKVCLICIRDESLIALSRPSEVEPWSCYPCVSQLVEDGMTRLASAIGLPALIAACVPKK